MLSSVEVFLGKSVGVNDGPRVPSGSAGRGERITSGRNEDADGRYPVLASTVVTGMTSEKEGKTDVGLFIALIPPSEGVRVEKTEDSVKTDVVGTAVKSDVK